MEQDDLSAELGPPSAPPSASRPGFKAPPLVEPKQLDFADEPGEFPERATADPGSAAPGTSAGEPQAAPSEVQDSAAGAAFTGAGVTAGAQPQATASARVAAPHQQNDRSSASSASACSAAQPSGGKKETTTPTFGVANSSEEKEKESTKKNKPTLVRRTSSPDRWLQQQGKKGGADPSSGPGKGAGGNPERSRSAKRFNPPLYRQNSSERAPSAERDRGGSNRGGRSGASSSNYSANPSVPQYIRNPSTGQEQSAKGNSASAAAASESANQQNSKLQQTMRNNQDAGAEKGGGSGPLTRAFGRSGSLKLGTAQQQKGGSSSSSSSLKKREGWCPPPALPPNRYKHNLNTSGSSLQSAPGGVGSSRTGKGAGTGAGMHSSGFLKKSGSAPSFLPSASTAGSSATSPVDPLGPPGGIGTQLAPNGSVTSSAKMSAKYGGATTKGSGSRAVGGASSAANLKGGKTTAKPGKSKTGPGGTKVSSFAGGAQAQASATANAHAKASSKGETTGQPNNAPATAPPAQSPPAQVDPTAATRTTKRESPRSVEAEGTGFLNLIAARRASVENQSSEGAPNIMDVPSTSDAPGDLFRLAGNDESAGAFATAAAPPPTAASDVDMGNIETMDEAAAVSEDVEMGTDHVEQPVLPNALSGSCSSFLKLPQPTLNKKELHLTGRVATGGGTLVVGAEQAQRPRGPFDTVDSVEAQQELTSQLQKSRTASQQKTLKRQMTDPTPTTLSQPSNGPPNPTISYRLSQADVREMPTRNGQNKPIEDFHHTIPDRSGASNFDLLSIANFSSNKVKNGGGGGAASSSAGGNASSSSQDGQLRGRGGGTGVAAGGETESMGSVESGEKEPKQQLVRVVCRVRPMLQREIEDGPPVVMTTGTNANEVAILRYPPGTGHWKRHFYQFDEVFGPSSTQEEVFDSVLAPRIQEVMSGFDASIIAYGQTGTGKTYTMEGSLEEDAREGAAAKTDSEPAEVGGEENESAAARPGADGGIAAAVAGAVERETSSEQHAKPEENRHAAAGSAPASGAGRAGTTGNKRTADGSSSVGDGSPLAAGDVKEKKTNPDKGLIPRALATIFHRLKHGGDILDSLVSCSYLEVYNEELTDLLSEHPREIKLRHDGKQTQTQGLSELNVEDENHAMELLRTAQYRRHIAETQMNKASSRSHCIFTIKVSCTVKCVGEGCLVSVGKLHLVDLAGSESAGSATKFENSRSADLKQQSRSREENQERKNINQSLLALARVMQEARKKSEGKLKITKDGKEERVPYRDSKLTRLLEQAIGGQSVTCIIATLSPSSACGDESMSTLNYANTCASIKNRPKQHIKLSVKNESAAQNMGKNREHYNMDLNGSGAAGPKTLGHSVQDWLELEVSVRAAKEQIEQFRSQLAKRAQNQQLQAKRIEELSEQHRDSECMRAQLQEANARLAQEAEDSRLEATAAVEDQRRSQHEAEWMRAQMRANRETLEQFKGAARGLYQVCGKLSESRAKVHERLVEVSGRAERQGQGVKELLANVTGEVGRTKDRIGELAGKVEAYCSNEYAGLEEMWESQEKPKLNEMIQGLTQVLRDAQEALPGSFEESSKELDRLLQAYETAGNEAKRELEGVKASLQKLLDDSLIQRNAAVEEGVSKLLEDEEARREERLKTLEQQMQAWLEQVKDESAAEHKRLKQELLKTCVAVDESVTGWKSTVEDAKLHVAAAESAWSKVDGSSVGEGLQKHLQESSHNSAATCSQIDSVLSRQQNELLPSFVQTREQVLHTAKQSSGAFCAQIAEQAGDLSTAQSDFERKFLDVAHAGDEIGGFGAVDPLEELSIPDIDLEDNSPSSRGGDGYLSRAASAGLGEVGSGGFGSGGPVPGAGPNNGNNVGGHRRQPMGQGGAKMRKVATARTPMRTPSVMERARTPPGGARNATPRGAGAGGPQLASQSSQPR